MQLINYNKRLCENMKIYDGKRFGRDIFKALDRPEEDYIKELTPVIEKSMNSLKSILPKITFPGPGGEPVFFTGKVNIDKSSIDAAAAFFVDGTAKMDDKLMDGLVREFERKAENKFLKPILQKAKSLGLDIGPKGNFVVDRWIQAGAVRFLFLIEE